MENSELVGKFVIVKDLMFSDYYKGLDGKIKVFDSYDEAHDHCWIGEFEDVLIVEVKFNYKEL